MGGSCSKKLVKAGCEKGETIDACIARHVKKSKSMPNPIRDQFMLSMSKYSDDKSKLSKLYDEAVSEISNVQKQFGSVLDSEMDMDKSLKMMCSNLDLVQEAPPHLAGMHGVAKKVCALVKAASPPAEAPVDAPDQAQESGDAETGTEKSREFARRAMQRVRRYSRR